MLLERCAARWQQAMSVAAWQGKAGTKCKQSCTVCERSWTTWKQIWTTSGSSACSPTHLTHSRQCTWDTVTGRQGRPASRGGVGQRQGRGKAGQSRQPTTPAGRRAGRRRGRAGQGKEKARQTGLSRAGTTTCEPSWTTCDSQEGAGRQAGTQAGLKDERLLAAVCCGARGAAWGVRGAVGEAAWRLAGTQSPSPGHAGHCHQLANSPGTQPPRTRVHVHMLRPPWDLLGLLGDPRPPGASRPFWGLLRLLGHPAGTKSPTDGAESVVGQPATDGGKAGTQLFSTPLGPLGHDHQLNWDAAANQQCRARRWTE